MISNRYIVYGSWKENVQGNVQVDSGIWLENMPTKSMSQFSLVLKLRASDPERRPSSDWILPSKSHLLATKSVPAPTATPPAATYARIARFSRWSPVPLSNGLKSRNTSSTVSLQSLWRWSWDWSFEQGELTVASSSIVVKPFEPQSTSVGSIRTESTTSVKRRARLTQDEDGEEDGFTNQLINSFFSVAWYFTLNCVYQLNTILISGTHCSG